MSSTMKLYDTFFSFLEANVCIIEERVFEEKSVSSTLRVLRLVGSGITCTMEVLLYTIYVHCSVINYVIVHIDSREIF